MDTETKAKTDAKLRVTMPDGSQWDVPVQIIADHRDEHYKDDAEDTIRFIRERSLDAFDIKDWAANNMNWSDVKDHAVKVKDAPECDYEDGWCNGSHRIVGTI